MNVDARGQLCALRSLHLYVVSRGQFQVPKMALQTPLPAKPSHWSLLKLNKNKKLLKTIFVFETGFHCVTFTMALNSVPK